MAITGQHHSVGEGVKFFQETARRQYRKKKSTHHPNLDRNYFRGMRYRTIVALMTVVVTACLLLPPGVMASLLAEIPPDHWSWRVITNLEEKALIPEGLLHFETGTRYEMARHIVDAFQLVEWMAGADVSLSKEPEPRAYFTRVQLELDRFKTLISARHGTDLSEDPSPVDKLQERMVSLREQVVAHHRLSDLSKGLVDTSAIAELRQALAGTEKEIAQLFDLYGSDAGENVLTLDRTTLQGVLRLWLTLHAQINAEQVPLDLDSSLALLTDDLLALAKEFQFEIYALGGSTYFLADVVQDSDGNLREERFLGKVEASSLDTTTILGDDIQADLDHLREAALATAPDNDPMSPESLALLGELRVGTNASVRIGYEIDHEVDYPGLPGKSVTGKSPQHNRAGIGFDYKIGERASLSASYSVLNFSILDFLDADGDDMGTRVGEAKLLVRF